MEGDARKMRDDKLKNPYFRQLKRGKLGLFEEIYLRHRGKNDYKRGIVCKDTDGKYISPFIEQEKNILGVAILKEEEVSKKAIVKSEIGIKIVESQKEGMQKKEKVITENAEAFSVKEKLHFAKSDLPLMIREKELSVYKNLENKIMRIRCQEINHIVLARISAYWSGVLHAVSKESKEGNRGNRESKEKEFRYIPMTYIDGKELLNQYFEDNKLWGGEDDD